MKILILGGTRFLGPHLVNTAISRGHELTLFNRGRLSSEKMPGVEVIIGDRHRDLDKLSGQTWDAVIDTSGYLPKSMEVAAAALSASVGTYVFVSSISAYAGFRDADYDETAPLARLTSEQEARVAQIDLTEDLTAPVLGDMYGALKAACEQTIEQLMPGRVLIVRPGLIAGPLDHTDRFTYWVMRIAEGGEVLAPGDPSQFVQVVDVRDVADFLIMMIEKSSAGVFNLVSIPYETTMGHMLETIRDVTSSDAKLTWVDEKFITDEGVAPWNELPLYLPASNGDSKGFMTANIDRALAAGLTLRPLTNTIRDTHDWRKTQNYPLRAGIDRERERDLLRKWHDRSS